MINSVEEHRIGVFVIHLLHVPQHILLGNHTEQATAMGMGYCGYLLLGPSGTHTHPLCVTSVWRSPSLRNMSTTVSIGV